MLRKLLLIDRGHFSVQAKIGLVSEMSQEGWLFRGDLLLHLGFLLHLLVVDGVVAFEAVFLFSLFSHLRQVVYLSLSLLVHAVDHLGDRFSSP